MSVDEQVIEWRRHLHRNPEPSFHEHDTARFIAETLASLGLEVTRPTETSVVARLGSAGGRTVALRADIDALPITEDSGVPFASERPGFMHACGHDGHTAMLLGAAKILSGTAVDGEVRFLFQHAEELAPGGARDMVAAGAMDGVDFVYGCHLWGSLPFGQVVAQPGELMAAADFFRLTVRGSGGHAGLPHESDDVVVAAAALVTDLQHVVARRIDPLKPAVISVGSLRAGDAPNVLPGEAVLLGTTRSFDPAIRKRLPVLVEDVARGVCTAHGTSYELDYRFGYMPVVNDAAATELVRDAVADELVAVDPIMGGDDVSALLAEAPGCYAFIGAGSAFPHHHPRFTIDERALAIGTRLHVEVAQRALRRG
jgi:amidohydrolase